MADKKNSVVVFVTEEQVRQMIAEAVKGMLTPDQFQAGINDATKHLATCDELAETVSKCQDMLIEYVNAVHPAFATPETAAAAVPAHPPLDPAWLEGLIFSGTTQERRIAEGRPRLVAIPFERELRPADVLGYRVTDSQVFLVTADGKKHTVRFDSAPRPGNGD
ncbi:MAG: hypothetical protein H7Y05_14990 [Steroidobacteraceae bacterium]|nr:hypothetical protein [Deltaproteobacteria bacterium]